MARLWPRYEQQRVEELYLGTSHSRMLCLSIHCSGEETRNASGGRRKRGTGLNYETEEREALCY